MKRILLLIGFTLALISLSDAQQKPHFSQYMINKYLVNPAVAGTEGYLEATISHRNQWTGIDGGPQTTYFSFQGAANHFGTGSGRRKHQKKSWNSFGGKFINDVTNPTTRTYINGTYAHNLALTNDIRLSLGVNAGLISYQVKKDFKVRDQDDIYLRNNSSLLPDFSLGLFLYNQKSFYFSLAADQVSSAQLFNTTIQTPKDNIGKLNWHYYISGGLIIPHTNKLKTIATTMVTYVAHTPFSVDLNARLIFDNTWWVGSNYRYKDSFSALVGYIWQNDIEVAYSYDITTSKLQHFESGSHEIQLAFKFPFKRSIDCPSMFW